MVPAGDNLRVQLVLRKDLSEEERKLVLEKLVRAGFELADRQFLLRFGILLGCIADQSLSALDAIDGVDSVEPDRGGRKIPR